MKQKRACVQRIRETMDIQQIEDVHARKGRVKERAEERVLANEVCVCI